MLQNRREGYDITWIPSSISAKHPLEGYEEPEEKEETDEEKDSIEAPGNVAAPDSVKPQEDTVIKTDTLPNPDEIEWNRTWTITIITRLKYIYLRRR